MRWVGWSLLFLLLASSGLAVPVGATCASGERCYDTDQTLDDSVTVAPGNVTVQAGARLTLRDSDLVLHSASPPRLTVEPGAWLILDGGRLRADAAPFDLVVGGTVEAKGAGLVLGRSIRVLDGGRITWDGGSIQLADGIATAASALLDVAHASIVTNDVDGSAILDGTTRLVDVRWNGTGRVQWTDSLDAQALVARGPAFVCSSGSLRLRDSDVRTPDGTALSTTSCTGSFERTSLAGRDAWSSSLDGTFVADALRLNATHGRALRLADGGPVLLRDSRAQAALQAVDVAADGDLRLERVDLTSGSASALRCAGGNVIATAGTWRAQATSVGAGAPAALTGCTGRLGGLALQGRGAAVRWDNGAGGPTTAVQLASLSFTNATGGGDGIPYAYDLRAAGLATGLQSTATLGLLKWRSVSAAPVQVANVTAGSSSCSIDVASGSFHLSDVRAAAGSKAVCAKASTLEVTAADLSAAATPLALESTSAALLDVRLDATHNTLDAASTVVAQRGFAPLATYKNGAPAPGALVHVRTLANATLAQSTADATGRPTPFLLEVFRQNATHLMRGADVRVRATLGALNNDTRLALDAHPLRVVLRDDVPPTAPGALRRRATAVTEVTVDWNASTDDHLSPSYEVRLRSPPGAKALLANGTRVAVDVARMVQATTAQVELPGQGLFWLNVTPVDRSGNRGPGRGLQAVWDTGKPTLQVAFDGDNATTGWYRGPVKVVINATDRESGVATNAIRADGAVLQGTSLEASGVHTVEVVVRDHAANEARLNRTIRIDRDAPLAMTVALASRRTAEAVSVDVTAMPQDAHSGVAEVRVWFEAGAVRSKIQALQLPLPASLPLVLPGTGAGAILVETVDEAGNSAWAAPVPVEASGSAGNIRIDSDDGSAAQGSPALGPALTMTGLLLALAGRRTFFKR